MLQNNNPVQIFPLALGTFVFSSFTQTQFSFPTVSQHRTSLLIPAVFLPSKAIVIALKPQFYAVPVNLWRVVVLLVSSSAVMSARMLMFLIHMGKKKRHFN